MALGLGVGLPYFGSKGGVADAADGSFLANALLGTEANGLAFVADDMSLVIRDTTTPANVFSGDANSKLTYSAPSTKYILNQSGIYVPGTALRCEYDASGNPLGIRIEEARTNVVLHSRDLTNAVWTKTSATAAKDQIGIDGVANSASSLTATAGNATCMQAITLASSARYQSAFIKRISGSGTIQMTMDNGTTWTTVTVTSSWAPVEIPTQTLANPTVGFRIVTSGDAIAVDVVGNENGAFRTSPAVTAGSTVTRAIDNITMLLPLMPSTASECTIFAKFIQNGATSSYSSVVSLDLGATNTSSRRIGTTNGTQSGYATARNAGVEVVSSIGAGTNALGSVIKLAARFKTDDSRSCTNGTLAALDSSGTLATDQTVLRLALSQQNGSFNSMHLQQLLVVPRGFSDAELQAVTT